MMEPDVATAGRTREYETTCSVELPATAMPYYLSGTVIDGQNFRYSTPLVLVKPADDPTFKATAKPDYEGAEWGGFEEKQLFMVRALGLARGLLVSPDARDGAQSAKLNPGVTRLLPFLYARRHCRLCLFPQADLAPGLHW